MDFTLKETLSKVNDFLSVNELPFTQQDELSEEILRHLTESLESALENALNLQCNTTTPMNTVRTIIKATFTERRPTSITDLVSGDLQIVLAGYGKIAVRRFVDHVPMLCRSMMEGIAKEVENLLLAVPDDKLEPFFEVPDHVTQEFEETKKRIGKLDEALKILKTLRTSNE